MKPQDFSQSLSAATAFLRNVGSSTTASEIELLAGLFARLEASSVAAIIKKCGVMKPTDCANADVANAGSITAVQSLAKFSLQLGKKPFAQDLDRLAEWLSQHRFMTIAQFVQVAETVFHEQIKKKAKPAKGASAETIALYLQRLDETYGFEPNFDEVYNQLKSDDTMKVAQLKKLAKQFTKATAKSRDDALNAIYSKHSNIVEADRHKAARGGRVS